MEQQQLNRLCAWLASSRRWVGLALVLFAAAGVGAVQAQTTSLPAMKFVTAPLMTPTDAETALGTSTHHTYGLSTVQTCNPLPCFGTDPEIVETAAALRSGVPLTGDPDLIFEFVHNQIDTEFAFGESKGPLGTLIDKSGTPFDQNALLVALLRQAGFPTARYQIGAYTLTAANFAAWTGISDIGAACKLLSSGGIPASFSPTQPPTNCQASGTFTSVTILTAWTKVQIGTTWCFYDPAFKTYAQIAPPLNLTTASGFVAGTPATKAGTGMSSGSTGGVPYIKTANATQLDSYLQSVGATLLNGTHGLKATAPSLDTDTVVGIPKIQPIYKPAGGWRITANPGTTWLSVTQDMPDQFRSQLGVAMTGALDGLNQQSLFSFNFYVDEIDGRRLGVDTNFDAAHNINPLPNYITATQNLMLDDVVVASNSCTINQTTCIAGSGPGFITLTATHPYPAGTFANQTVVKPILSVALPVAIVSGWGRISPARLAKWSDEKVGDKGLPVGGTAPFRCEDGSTWCRVPGTQSAGDFTRQKLAASWLAQMTRMARIQATMSGAAVEPHHSIGVVDWRAAIQSSQFPPPPFQNSQYWLGVADEFTDLNIDSVLSVSPASNATANVPAISRSIALASAVLEGSVLEQMEDLPDTASTASRFAWGNSPDNEDPCFSSSHPRPFYDYTATTFTTRASLYTYEGSASGCGAAPYTPQQIPANVIANTETLVSGYVNAWTGTTYHVTGSAETFLGPGARFGAAHTSGVTPLNDPSSQRGGAVIATQWDSSGNVIQVAHALSSPSGISKGGGGKQPESFAEYDPAKAADALKDRFVERGVVLGVDLKTGEAGYTTPTLLSVGAGDAPYKLDYGLSFKAGPGCAGFGPCTGPVTGGWNQTWDVRFSNSGSGLEAMGQTTPFAAAGSLVAFLALQDLFAQSGLADLNKDVFAALVGDWWRQQMIANAATINRGFSGAQYLRLIDNTWAPPVGSPGTLVQNGARAKVRDTCQPVAGGEYPYSTSRRWDHSNVTFSLTSAGGDVLNVTNWLWPYNPDNACLIVYGYKPTTWTWPQGLSLSFTYDYLQGVTGITTSLGRTMSFTGAGQLLTAASTGLTAGETVSTTNTATIADANGNEKWNFNYQALQPRTATMRPVPYPRLSQIFEPVSATAPALQYTYDSRGLVNGAQDATSLQWGTRLGYAWFLALGERGRRQAPDGGSYIVYYDTDGNSVRDIDELAREVDSVWDGRHRVTSRTFPESDQEAFVYDANDNVTQLTKIPKPGSGLANIVIHATYETSWNKLASITDAMGNETDFTYYPNTSACGSTGVANSMMCKAQRPAVGGSRPTFTFQYDSTTTATHLVSQSVDPNGVTTRHGYDSFGDLTSTTEGAAAVGSNPALNLVTSFTPDAVGNVVAVIDPRGNATTTTYDNMRRKTLEDNLNGGVTALPIKATEWFYDLNGRQITEKRATAFDGSGVPTWGQTWTTAYTPTGKVASKKDPLSEFTYTFYDPVDREQRILDASGLITTKTYDLAGQETIEQRGEGTPLSQHTASFTWGLDGEKTSVTDANTNTIQLGYDGFNRLSKISHPDLTTELSAYDPNGDLTNWTNRGGFSLVRCYDVLSRKLSETGISGVANDNTACPNTTAGTPNLNTRSWDMQPRTFTYDLAGHLTQADNGQETYNWSYDAAGRPKGRTGSWPMTYVWDAAGNMTGITYADGSVFTYQYDALNRMSAALTGATTLASLTYDPLGRRSVLTFGDASSQTWNYNSADRVTSLVHAFPTTTGNTTLNYTYDPAGRELQRGSPNNAYNYSPTVASTAYATANALNQYPSVASYPYTWWPEGPMLQDDQRQGQYDETGQLMNAYVTVTPGTVDTNNFVLMRADALGHVAFHEPHPAAGAAYPQFYHATDGLRPETVLDLQYTHPASGSPTLDGYRRYVLGPGDDERWAWEDIDGTWRYPHTDREGTTIAISEAGSAVRKYAYDAYGQGNGTIIENGSGSSAADSYPFRYTGQRLDGGTGLYDYKARFYSAQTGRFLQPDPAGVDQGPNLYLYVQDDPVGARDPSGNAAEEEDLDPEPIDTAIEAERARALEDEIRETNPRYRLEESSLARSARLQQYDIFGRGNLNGTRSDETGQATSSVAERIQGVLSRASLQGTLRGVRNTEGFQFTASGGASAAGSAFSELTGGRLASQGETVTLQRGDSTITANYHISSGQGGDRALENSTTLEVRISTPVTGSNIPVQTFVKIRFPG